jgi:hypothetical protein
MVLVLIQGLIALAVIVTQDMRGTPVESVSGKLSIWIISELSQAVWDIVFSKSLVQPMF